MFRLSSPSNLAAKIFAITLTAFISFSTLPSFSNVKAASTNSNARPAGAGDFVIEYSNGVSTCRQATAEEAAELSRPTPTKGLHRITPVHTDATGLNIILLGTDQLEQTPTAKAAFIRAAANWQAAIKTPITIMIKVDYGTTRFGTPWKSPNILGATTSQMVFNPVGYNSFRSALVSSASNSTESQLYPSLPSGNSLPTDVGNVSTMEVNTTVLRAIGLMSPTANPDGEVSGSIDPSLPSIGFNSNFQFDFDPSDGIDFNKIDFDATATHEIGHALGFTTWNGLTTDPNILPTPTSTPPPQVLSAWDLFRFNGSNFSSFATSPRMLQSGGSQIFYGGGSQLSLSTGGLSGQANGGDGWQSSHWKISQGIGIMDPAISNGVRKTISPNDVAVLNSIGYWLTNETAPNLPQTSPGTNVTLSSGVGQSGTLSSAPVGSCFVSPTQYAIQVPAGATQLKIDLSGTQDVDLHVRFGQRVLRVVGWPGLAEYISDSENSTESITITPTSSAPLQAGTYYIAIDNCGSAASFTVTANVTAPPTNPIDDAQTFVTQHYRDFLNRDPDTDGLNYWTGQITQCGSDQTCIHNQRIGVSAAFYIELEFQKTGSVIYRMYRASYGASQSDPLLANVSYQQFIADRPLIDANQIQASTQSFANTFVQRQQFKSVYPDTMSNTEFVNKLYDTAGLTPYTNERQAQITAMSTGKTRAQVLLDVIEIPEFKNREFNRGFVLMQYFGYLRRDVDTGGYDFWLDVLNRLPAPNNFRNMVCAFITSGEYQQRFGTTITRHNTDCASN